MWGLPIGRGGRGASSSSSPGPGGGGGGKSKLVPSDAPSCFVEVYNQHDLHQGHLVAVPQLLQCWTGGLLKRERVCSWLSLDLALEVTDAYIEHWFLGPEGLAVKLLLFDEARARQEGSPFRNGARVVVCCSSEPLCIDAAARIQGLCPAQPLCRALTHGIIESSGCGRSRECSMRRAEIWTIVDQLRSVVQWTEEALKRCNGRGYSVNSECLVLAYHLLVGLSLGTDCLERLDGAREHQRNEYAAIRAAVTGLNLHTARLFDSLQKGGTEDNMEDEGEAEEGTLYHDMLHVAGRILTAHAQIVGQLATSCIPLDRIDSARSRAAACICLVGRPGRGTDGRAGSRDGFEEEMACSSHSSGLLPSRPPGAARASAERRERELGPQVKEKPAVSLANSVQAGAQLDRLLRSTHHI